MSESDRPAGSIPPILLVGGGRMGSAMLAGWRERGLAASVVVDPAPEFAGLAGPDLTVVATASDIPEQFTPAAVVLAVKPQSVAEALPPHARFAGKAVFLSIMAGRTIAGIAGLVGPDAAIVRAMPNTPAALGAGAAALCRGRFVRDDQMELAKRVFDTVGRTVIVDEKHMDAVTGLSASGPAYIYIIIEALAEAGVKVGLPRETATQLAAQTTFGAAKMVLETGYHPALLKDQVTTPAGCTIDGILELEEGGLRVTLIKAVMRATERAKQLAAG